MTNMMNERDRTRYAACEKRMKKDCVCEAKGAHSCNTKLKLMAKTPTQTLASVLTPAPVFPPSDCVKNKLPFDPPLEDPVPVAEALVDVAVLPATAMVVMVLGAVPVSTTNTPANVVVAEGLVYVFGG